MQVTAEAEGQEQRRSDTTRPARAHNAHFGILMGLDASYPETGFQVPQIWKAEIKGSNGRYMRESDESAKLCVRCRERDDTDASRMLNP
jgi:hypothetical protein